MIPQADLTWFLSQIIWTLVFLSLQIAINQFLIFRKPAGQKISKQTAIQKMIEKIHLIKEDISSLKNHKTELKLLMEREEALIKSEVASEKRVVFLNQLKDLRQEVANARKEIESFVPKAGGLDIKKVANVFLSKVRTR